MQIRELTIPDAYELTPLQRRDERGVFLEWYRFDVLERTIGHPMALRQANTSVSKKGVVRGVHFADTPLGQAKYVTVAHGAVLDYIVDIRVGSPTFGQWDSVLLDDLDRRAVYLSEGLGHAFVALQNDSVVTYLVTDVYNPAREHGINPLDPAIGLAFPHDAGEALVSPKDAEAPTLERAQANGLLPEWTAMRAYYASLTAERD